MLRNGVSKGFRQAAGPSCPAIIRAPENDMQGPGPGRPHRGVSVTAPQAGPGPPLRLSLSLAVLVDLWEGPAVPRGTVHAQGHRAPWQRVSRPLKARCLQTVLPGGLQRQDQREHHHLAAPR